MMRRPMNSTPPDRATVPAWQTAAAFAACSLIWGSTFLVISIGNDTVAPIWAAALRLIVAALILAAVMLVTRQPWPRGAAFKAATLYGLFQFGANFPLLYWGETVVPSGLAAIIFATIPLTTAIFTRIAGLEKLSAPRIAGALVAFAGVLVIFASELSAKVPGLPMFAILAATWLACVGTICLKRGPHQNPIASNAVATPVGAFVCVVLSVIAGETRTLPTTGAEIFPILYLAIAGSVGAFVIFTWLVTHWEITRASYISVVLPVVALTLGTWVRQERVHALSLLGSGIVLLGVAIGLQMLPLKPMPARAD